mmetsp:Transcript_90860/g.266015  ORF Transcript_90860/g.266015 Transcript_90860/m.266015 type:complete len:208 (+) Transcript_90860:999-1622(+)
MTFFPFSNVTSFMAMRMVSMSCDSSPENMKLFCSVPFSRSFCSSVLLCVGAVNCCFLFHWPYASALTDCRARPICCSGFLKLSGISSQSSSSSSSSSSASAGAFLSSLMTVPASSRQPVSCLSSCFSMAFVCAMDLVLVMATPLRFRSQLIMNSWGLLGISVSTSLTISSKMGSKTSRMYFFLSSAKGRPSTTDMVPEKEYFDGYAV